MKSSEEPARLVNALIVAPTHRSTGDEREEFADRAIDDGEAVSLEVWHRSRRDEAASGKVEQERVKPPDRSERDLLSE